MSVTVLRAGIDTLEASFGGKVDEGVAERFEAAKLHAQHLDSPIPFAVTFVDFLVQPKGVGRWRWVLKDPDMDLRLNQGEARYFPAASVRLSALGLANHDAKELYDWSTELLGGLGQFSEKNLSRLDVAVDFQGWIPSAADSANFVCPAVFRPVYPSIYSPETFHFGRGDLVVRLYNKTAELKKSGKGWLVGLWEQVPSYEPETPVWRVEGQLRGKVLKELRVGSVNQAIDDVGRLLEFALRWCQLRVPTADTKKTRWPEDERWARLRTARFDGLQLSRHVGVPKLLPTEQAIRRHLGLAATIAAQVGWADYADSVQLLSSEGRCWMNENGVDFADMVETKRRRLISGG